LLTAPRRRAIVDPVKVVAAALSISLASPALVACERNKEVTAEEVRAALAAAGYAVTPKGADPDAPPPTQSSCFDMAGSGSKQSVCVWRCADGPACQRAMRDMMESVSRRKHAEIATFQVDRCVVVERDCTGPSCPRLHEDVEKTHVRW
jgi:hypothetical protein